MRSLKGITAKRANAMLALTGHPFWQEESYDHLVRDQSEFENVRNYIEENPVRAGLVTEASEYRWVERGRGDRGVARGPWGPPHRYINQFAGPESFRTVVTLGSAR
jgi:hypothetical protein